jgi:hypothetical protein
MCNMLYPIPNCTRTDFRFNCTQIMKYYVYVTSLEGNKRLTFKISQEKKQAYGFYRRRCHY